jgi:hypothetical protein
VAAAITEADRDHTAREFSPADEAAAALASISSQRDDNRRNRTQDFTSSNSSSNTNTINPHPPPRPQPSAAPNATAVTPAAETPSVLSQDVASDMHFMTAFNADIHPNAGGIVENLGLYTFQDPPDFQTTDRGFGLINDNSRSFRGGGYDQSFYSPGGSFRSSHSGANGHHPQQRSPGSFCGSSLHGMSAGGPAQTRQISMRASFDSAAGVDRLAHQSPSQMAVGMQANIITKARSQGLSAAAGPENDPPSDYGAPVGGSHSPMAPPGIPLKVPRPPPSQNELYYPVLKNIIQHTRVIMPVGMTNALLECYFKCSVVTSAPLSPCVPPGILRRASILKRENPRPCSPALLASLLWVSAQTADIPSLNAHIARRKYIRRKLLELTIKLLKPLNEVALRDGVVSTESGGRVPNGFETKLSTEHSASGGLDEIIAYIHLAMVTSASEFRAASLRWWNIAWSLAREAKLNQEVVVPESDLSNMDAGYENAIDSMSVIRITDEQREERRRVWWFLFSMDRHLSLCYNKPLFLHDRECQRLRRPVADSLWATDDSAYRAPPQAAMPKTGAWFECTGPCFYGFFTPLMTILGEVMDLFQARNHPRLATALDGSRALENWEVEITKRISIYEQSLDKLDGATPLLPAFPSTASSFGPVSQSLTSLLPTTPLNGANNSPSAATDTNSMSRSNIRMQIAQAYARLIVHVLHVLVPGKLDPLDLLDNSATWIATQSFVTATGHAINAALAADTLMDLDPSMNFMPFYAGIYLLHGSFLLLLLADHLKTNADLMVINACKTMVRVHETSIVRLQTDYQVCF